VNRPFIIFLTGLAVFFNLSAFADQYVHGYTRSNGTYVHSYYRSSPDSTVTNNFTYKGNINPYTGAVGANRYIHDKTSAYYQGPDSHGRVGHPNATDMREEIRRPYELQGHRDSYSVSLCAPPHFRMTEQDGCQPTR
jgi:hypothetical protein